MLRRNKKFIKIAQHRRLKNTAKYFVSWSYGLLGGIAGFFGIPENKVNLPLPNESKENKTTRPAPPERFIIFSDTDNDLKSVKATLRFTGVLSQKGELVENIQGMTIFHTGDLIDKNNPDLSVVEYWQLLQQDALRKGCHVRLIAGNHEQEVWLRMQAGKKYGLEADQAQKLNNFIESLDLFYVAGPVLFIHGYPTLEFLQTLLHYKEVTGRELNCFNKDHYEKSFISIRAMKQYAYVRAGRKANFLLYDVTDAGNYYKKKGRLIGAILEQLKIDIVVHGHKPQRSGTQADYEFSKWIPNIRMIGNDTSVSRRGIGATVISVTATGAFDIVFVNSKSKSDDLRRKVRKNLSDPFEPRAENLFVGTQQSPENRSLDALQ